MWRDKAYFHIPYSATIIVGNWEGLLVLLILWSFSFHSVAIEQRNNCNGIEVEAPKYGKL